MRSLLGSVDKLCTPAYFYLVISTIALIIIGLQNVSSRTTYCVGDYQCPVENSFLVFVIKILYVAFWTWILNLICKSGYSIVSWILVLIPFVSMFLLMISFILFKNRIPIV
jgi:hypothetical protein